MAIAFLLWGYIAGVILFDGFLEKLKELFRTSSALKARLLAVKNAIALFLPSFEQYRYILQRTATLLAVAELTLCGLAALTGILLAFYYQPAAMEAHESLSAIARDIANGAVVLSLHHIAGQGLIVLALVQIIVMFLGREFLPAWFAGWLSGIALTLTAIGLSWTAIVLDWEQTSFWRFRVELNIVASIPWAGPILRDILSGGGGINSITLQHMYALHSYVLAIAAVLLSILHLAALIYQEQHWKPAETR
ncbi:MAG: cytochrome b N-terminal domain-containing protein [Cyanobacteriota bacterium]|nr:cytochrome b N-terminal domain-containing protein [Cyanobacteriota bacterium]